MTCWLVRHPASDLSAFLLPVSIGYPAPPMQVMSMIPGFSNAIMQPGGWGAADGPNRQHGC